MIKGKFNGHVYFSCLFVLIFSIISLYLLFHPDLKLKGRGGYIFPAPFIGVIFFLLTGFLFYVMSKVAYWVTIDSGFINIKGIFKRKLIAKSEIREIDLFSKEDFHWSAGLITIGTKIELEDDEIFILADPLYRNISILKQGLVDYFADKIKPYKTIKPQRFIPKSSENSLEKFSGNPYTSFNGILFSAIILFFAYLLLNQQQLKTGYLFFIPFGIVLYLGLGSQMNYFLVSDNYLIIKNHFLFWKNKKYNIGNVIQANFEIQHKRSDALRITTSNFKSRSYSAGSLRKKDWGALREKLESLGIYFV